MEQLRVTVTLNKSDFGGMLEVKETIEKKIEDIV